MDKQNLCTQNHLYPAQAPGYLRAEQIELPVPAMHVHLCCICYFGQASPFHLPNGKRGEKTNHSSTYCCCSLSCQHVSQTSSPPRHVDTKKWLPFALWLLCFILSDVAFVAFAVLIRLPSPNNGAIVSGNQRISETPFLFPALLVLLFMLVDILCLLWTITVWQMIRQCHLSG